MDKRFVALWAKSAKEHSGHPVVAHLLDVAASAQAILQLEPASTRELYAADLGLSHEDALPWVYTLAGLHDIGKVSPAFQQKWDRGFAQLISMEPAFDWHRARRLGPTKPPHDVPHSLVSQVTLPKLLERHGFSYALGSKVADAVGCHHGYRALATDIDKAEFERERGVGIWDTAREVITHAVRETVGANAIPIAKTLTPAGFIRLAGLTSFADWIGSSFYPELRFDGFEDDLPGYYQAALNVARKRVRELGWTPRLPLRQRQAPLEEVFGYLAQESGQAFLPRALQTEVQHLMETVSAPTLLLIEAPMGEGKTEAAFYAHLRLQAELGHRGLYIALPTMATGNMMFGRTARFLNEQAHERDLPLDLQLLHGATQLNAQYGVLRGELAPNTEDEVLEYVEAREYFTHKRRALLSEYGVGTVDQILLTILNIKWHFVRLWGLSNRVVVIDEVHAYDTYTSSLVETLVRWLHALGSSVVLMSATLPRSKRKELLEAYGGTDVITDQYPRIFKVSAGRTDLATFDADPTRRLSVSLEAAPSDVDTLAALLTQKLEQGGCAVCIVNTVDRAQKLFTKLAGLERYLFHARFPAEDRAELENRVIATFGKDATRENGQRPEKAVLIATQVVEQSLDLDFDLMVSDLAPVDLLLQRAGRLWRHPRGDTRPIPGPVLHVAGLRHEGELPDLASPYWNKVYDPYVLYRTWRVLQGRTELVLPDDIDPLVQTVYADDPAAFDDLSPEARSKIEADRERFEQEGQLDRLDGENAVVSHVRRGELRLRDATPSREDDDKPNARPVALTRKGDTSRTVVPLYRLRGGYFLDAQGRRPYDPENPLDTFKRSVRLSRVGIIGDPKRRIQSALELHNAQHGIDQDFAHWEKDALLRSCMPLVLKSSGVAVIGKTEVSLDALLGVVYRRP